MKASKPKKYSVREYMEKDKVNVERVRVDVERINMAEERVNMAEERVNTSQTKHTGTYIKNMS